MFDLSVFTVRVTEQMSDVGFSIVLFDNGRNVDSSLVAHARCLLENPKQRNPSNGLLNLATRSRHPTHESPNQVAKLYSTLLATNRKMHPKENT
jgi:hypothetical protein